VPCFVDLNNKIISLKLAKEKPQFEKVFSTKVKVQLLNQLSFFLQQKLIEFQNWSFIKVVIPFN
jgi:hypothetical protein